MRKFVISSLVVLAMMVALQMLVIAQDAEPPHSLEDVASSPADYYGQIVIIDGYIGNFVNSSIFVLTENAIFDNDMVLVLNNSGEPFDLPVTLSAQVRVTGMVYESLATLQSNRRAEEAEAMVNDPNRAATTDIVPVETVEPEPFNGHGILGLQFIYDGHIWNEYNNFTIIVVDNAADVQVLVGADGEDFAMVGVTHTESSEADVSTSDDTTEMDTEATEATIEETADPEATEESGQ